MMRFQRIALAMGLASFAAGCSGGGGTLSASLPSLDGSKVVDLHSCPGAKCLTIYVAPWCGVCRASTGLIGEFREYLAARGVTTRVVVGRDSLEAVQGYAVEFGKDSLLDPEGKVPLSGGVPQFIVSDGAGRVLKRAPGVPSIEKPPIPEKLLHDFAEYLDLP